MNKELKFSQDTLFFIILFGIITLNIDVTIINNTTLSCTIPNTILSGDYYLKIVIVDSINESRTEVICNSHLYINNIQKVNINPSPFTAENSNLPYIITLNKDNIIKAIFTILTNLNNYLLFFEGGVYNPFTSAFKCCDNNIKFKIESPNLTLLSIKSSSSIININSDYQEDELTDEILYSYLENFTNSMKQLNKSSISCINSKDERGYSLVHYIIALDYVKSLNYLITIESNILSLTSNDGYSLFEIASGRWNLNTLLYLSSLNSSLINIEIIRKGLNLAIESSMTKKDKNLEVLYFLLKQLKIEFTIEDASEKLLDSINNSHNNISKLEVLQNVIKTWLKRNKYIDLKKSTMKLQHKLKNYLQRKKFITIKNKTIIIQKAFRQWKKNNHK